MAMDKSLAPFYFESAMVNMTQCVTVSLGAFEIGRYYPGTRHSEFAITEVQAAFALALADLVRPILRERNIREDDGSITDGV